jgi:predicted kinase
MPKLIVTVGLPASGKSTWLAQRGINAISSDELRRWLADDPTVQHIHRIVFGAVRYLIVQRLKIGRPETYIDATSLTRWERRPYIRLGQLYHCDVEALFFDIPLEICIERNNSRDRVVPNEAIRAMALKLMPPRVEEGFSAVRIVSQTEL